MDTGTIVGYLVGVIVAMILVVVISFRSIRLRTEGAPTYDGLWRWIGERVKTRAHVLSAVAGLAFGTAMLFLVLLLIAS